MLRLNSSFKVSKAHRATISAISESSTIGLTKKQNRQIAFLYTSYISQVDNAIFSKALFSLEKQVSFFLETQTPKYFAMLRILDWLCSLRPTISASKLHSMLGSRPAYIRLIQYAYSNR